MRDLLIVMVFMAGLVGQAFIVSRDAAWSAIGAAALWWLLILGMVYAVVTALPS